MCWVAFSSPERAYTDRPVSTGRFRIMDSDCRNVELWLSSSLFLFVDVVNAIVLVMLP